MSEGQAAPKKGMNPILKWIFIGCGTIVLLMILAMAGCAYGCHRVAKSIQEDAAKEGVVLDTSHGLRGMATSATTAALQGMKPVVLTALPKADQPAADKAFKDIAAKGGQLTDEDMNDLNKAMDAYNRANQAYQQGHGSPLDPDAARTFVSDLQAIADRH